MVIIIDYGMGNLGSISNMLKRVGVASQITSKAEEIARAARIILPGVGHFDRAMERLNDSGIRPILERKALIEKVPVLGICLGMQIMTCSSEEGSLPGMGWVPAATKRFRFEPDSKLKVPHMGWNVVRKAAASPLTEGFYGEFRFYFVHSYYVRVEDEQHAILKTPYGIEFDAGIQKENIFGVQFHPEKSHKFGIKLFENFVRL